MRLLSPAPATFVASDASSPAPLDPPLVLAGVAAASNDTVADVVCSVSATATGGDVSLVMVGTNAAGATLQSIPAVGGRVNVPGVVVVTNPATAGITLTLSCRRALSGDVLPALVLDIPATQLRVALCGLPPTQGAVGAPLPQFSVGVATHIEGGAASDGCTGSGVLPPLPGVACTVSFNASDMGAVDTSEVYLQQAAALVSGGTHRAVFDALTLVASLGRRYRLVLTCAVGGLAIPPALSFSVELEGCAAGREAVLLACVPCGGGAFSLGGLDARCADCPSIGASCSGGILTLLPHYFRPPVQAGAQLGPDTELHPCYNAEACTLTYSNGSNNASGPVYGCATGYMGPLCGVCDAAVNYARFGEACGVCWEAGASWTFFMAVVLLVAAVLTRVALRKESNRSDAAIVLRITLGFLQGVGSLRVFRAGSTQAYANVMGWTEVVSASPLSVGALQCILRLPYLFQYVATIALPVAASVAVALIFLGVTLARSIHVRPACRYDSRAAAAAVAAWLASKRHLSTLLFVLFLTYMPIISASLRALDCVAPIAGIRYLRSDLSVECGVGQHAAARALSFTVLAVVGVGFPAGLAWLLGTATNDQLLDGGFHSTWGFLFDGYRAPSRSLVPVPASPPPVVPRAGPGQRAATKSGATTRRRSTLLPDRLQQAWVVSGDSRVWWEAVVLCRKAGVVLLAVTVTNPYLQCVGASLWFLAAAALQARYSPYTKRLFNMLEMATLVATLLTALISTALLQYNVGVSSADLHPPAAMTPIEWTVTVALTVLNLGTFVGLAGLWLRLQCARAHGALQQTAAIRALVRYHRSKTKGAVSSWAASGDGDGDGGGGGTPVADDAAAAHAMVSLNPLRSGVRTKVLQLDAFVAPEAAGSSTTPEEAAPPPLALPPATPAPAPVAATAKESRVVSYAATPVARVVRRGSTGRGILGAAGASAALTAGLPPPLPEHSDGKAAAPPGARQPLP